MAAMAWAKSGGFGGSPILHSVMVGSVPKKFYYKTINPGRMQKAEIKSKAGILFATKSGLSGFSPGISGYSHPDYPDLCPESPDTLVVFQFVPTLKMQESF